MCKNKKSGAYLGGLAPARPFGGENIFVLIFNVKKFHAKI